MLKRKREWPYRKQTQVITVINKELDLPSMKSALEPRPYCLVSSVIGRKLLAPCLKHRKGLLHVIYAADGEEDKEEEEAEDRQK